MFRIFVNILFLVNMKNSISSTLYPKNYIIAHPTKGAIILFFFTLGFAILYKPLNAHEGQFLNFEITMLVYSFIASAAAWLAILGIHKISYFSGPKKWTLPKEILSVIIVLLVMGIAVFFTAFLLEPPAETSRWNFSTFFDSCKRTFLIGLIPFAYFISINLGVLFRKNINPITLSGDDLLSQKTSKKINISSSLKKENLNFYENQLLFVMSEGNYAIFHLLQDNNIKKVPIRNSISNIEKQLKNHPAFFRCHRAFIVNINRVDAKKGNALGYQMSMTGTQLTVPVSRQNIKKFDKLFDFYRKDI